MSEQKIIHELASMLIRSAKSFRKAVSERDPYSMAYTKGSISTLLLLMEFSNIITMRAMYELEDIIQHKSIAYLKKSLSAIIAINS